MVCTATRKKLTAAIVAAGLFSAVPAFASPYLTNSGFTTNNLPANDDNSTGLVNIGFNVNFFGTSYSQLYVNNNGNVTFNTAASQYTPTDLTGPTSNPIIAPFFADVDTRGAGSGLVTYGDDTVDGHTAFGVDSANVGYYDAHTDKLNTFQMVLIDRSDVGAGDFDIEFNYTTIKWETGDASGGTDGLGGTSAAVGYSAGSGTAGTFAQLAGSFVNGALLDGGPDALVSNTNDGVAGQYLFEVRNGTVITPPPPPPTSSVPLPSAAWASLPVLGMLGLFQLLRPKKTA